MNNNKFTDIQEEKIYVCSKTENEEENDKKITKFFSEIVNRRRDDPFEGGLQAGIVVFTEKSAMKICENDGTASHLNTYINLTKYLNDDHKYISANGTGFFFTFKNEQRQLFENGIEIRILDGKDELLLAITSKIKTITEYQIEMLNKILFFCKMLKDKKTYNSVKIGIHVLECEAEVEELSDEHYNNILNNINSLQKNALNTK